MRRTSLFWVILGLILFSCKNENTIKIIKDQEKIQLGKNIYLNKCSSFHRANGGGGKRPNLTDNYWLHGGSSTDVYNVIHNEVISKGMIPWKNKLTTDEIQYIMSYILVELKGSKPKLPKEAEGKLV